MNNFLDACELRKHLLFSNFLIKACKSSAESVRSTNDLIVANSCSFNPLEPFIAASAAEFVAATSACLAFILASFASALFITSAAWSTP